MEDQNLLKEITALRTRARGAEALAEIAIDAAVIANLRAYAADLEAKAAALEHGHRVSMGSLPPMAMPPAGGSESSTAGAGAAFKIEPAAMMQPEAEGFKRFDQLESSEDPRETNSPYRKLANQANATAELADDVHRWFSAMSRTMTALADALDEHAKQPSK